MLGTDYLEILGDKGKIIVENSKKLTVRKMNEEEQVLSKNMDMKDVMNLSRTMTLKLYTETVEEFNSVHWQQITQMY